MDASGSDLCILETQRREIIRVQYTPDELEELHSGSYANSINVRELQSAVLAALCWGRHWTAKASENTTYVCFHIDNTSAVAWASKRASRHPILQLYNRLLSLAEFEHKLAFTAEHIPGKLNTMADAGSRAWNKTHPLWCRSSTSFRQSLKRMGATLCGAAIARTTTRKYRAHWIQWRGFSKFMRWSPWLNKSDRSSSKKLAYFAIYLWKYGWNTSGRGNQYPTIQSKLSSVFWYHRRYVDVDLSRSPLLRVLLQGIKRLSDSTKKKMPVTPAFLRILRRSLHLNRPRDRLLWGSVLLGYFFLLRRSEYLAVGRHRYFYCLKTKDVFFTDALGNPATADMATAVTIGLSGAKNDQYGRVRALKHLLQARQDLRATDHKHLCADLTAEAVRKALKDTARRAGVDSTNYSTHSLRSGGATALLSGKADSLSIKILGRWVSRCFEDYPLQAAVSTSDLSRRMIFPQQTRLRPSNKLGGR